MIEQKPIDKLTLLHFVADIIRCSESEYHYDTHWLCTRTDIQDDAVKVAKEQYEDWKAKELKAKSAREDAITNRPYLFEKEL